MIKLQKALVGAAVLLTASNAEAAQVSAVFSGGNADHTISGIFRWDTDAPGYVDSTAPNSRSWFSEGEITLVKDGASAVTIPGTIRYITSPLYADVFQFFNLGTRIQTFIDFDFPMGTYTGGTLPTQLPAATGTYSYSSSGQGYVVPLTFFGSAVPEPGSWALMIGGIGLAGGMVRRQRANRINFA